IKINHLLCSLENTKQAFAMVGGANSLTSLWPLAFALLKSIEKERTVYCSLNVNYAVVFR
ncbi:hypothetical protein, partial [Bacillus sp. SG-1]|uniref:hypothetical protein n=1 Tax=Bacillus sp. SG-1 TaxID=161544 RepID=UPI0005C5402E